MLRPWQGTLLDLHRQVDELFERLIFRPWAITSPIAWRPPLDFHETTDAYVIEVDLPGVPPEAVRILVDDRTLVITGERHPSRVEGSLGSRCERVCGAFQRVLELPGAVEPTQVKAECQHGTYRIHLPRRQVATPTPEQGASFAGSQPAFRVVHISIPNHVRGESP